MKLWLVRPAKKPDCCDCCDYHVKRVLTKSVSKVEKDKKGEVSFMKRHNIKHATVILTTATRFTKEIPVTRCGWHLVQSVVTKDTMSATVKLAKEIEKSVTDVVGIASWRIRECMLVTTANSAERHVW